MRKIHTLKKNYEFKNVLKNGKYFIKKHVIVYINKNNTCENIIGIAINAKLCNAVKRNKIKRIIRESFYKEKQNLKKGYNIVFLWNKKEPVDNIEFCTIHREIAEIFKEAGIVEKD